MRLRPLYLSAALVIAVMLAVSVWAWPQIPDDALIPTHWNAAGEADGYSSKPFGLFGLPAICAGLTVLLGVLPKVEPRRQNLEKSASAYIAVGVAALALMATLHVAAVLSAVGKEVDIGTASTVGLSLLFLVIGAAMHRVRSNWFLGFRTPWTLTSERSWERTHRAASVVFVVMGAVSLITMVVAGPPVSLWVLLDGVVLAVVGLVFYSYLVWRDDPDRTNSFA